MWIVAVACFAFAVIQGWRWLEGVVHDPASNAIQFGEYLTIPGLAASALLGALLGRALRSRGTLGRAPRPSAGTLVLSKKSICSFMDAID